MLDHRVVVAAVAAIVVADGLGGGVKVDVPFPRTGDRTAGAGARSRVFFPGDGLGPDALFGVLLRIFGAVGIGLAAGLWLKFEDDRVVDARFAFGGMAAIVRRAAGAEAAVRGQLWTENTVRSAMRALDADFQPLSDLRASASYRRRAARNLLQRLWLETRADAPLPADQVSVWSAA